MTYQANLFLSRTGNKFTDSTFCHWWERLLQKTAPANIKDTKLNKKLTPSLARTSFVESITSLTGMDPNEWDGYAYAMGNTRRTWERNYAPTLIQRKRQHAVNSYASLSSQLRSQR